MKTRITGALCVLVAAALIPCPAYANTWERSEKGNRWMYVSDAGDPATDEWIDEDGKQYYVDSSGYMKTGWLKDKESGNEYYFGDDGVMWSDAFTPDDRYVGPDGRRVTPYDTYRKAVKTQLKKSLNSKKSKESVPQRYFLLTDLNQDGYRDLVIAEWLTEVTDGAAATPVAEDVGTVPGAAAEASVQNGTVIPAGGRLIEISVWDPEEEEFQLAAEFEQTDDWQQHALYFDPQEQGIWMETIERGGDIRLFQMANDTPILENVWSFTMDFDEWGGPVYYRNGVEEDKEVWDRELAFARQERGNTPLSGYLSVTEENISSQVDLMLSEEELDKWEPRD